MELTNKDKALLEWLENKMQSGELSNDGLVQFIELTGRFLNLETIPDYAKRNKMSYNGVKNFRKTVNLFNVTFVIDNE